MRELYIFGFLAVMVLTTVVLKGIFCFTQCAKPESKEVKLFLEKKKKELSASKSKLVQLEIPMEDIERTSTPVPAEEKKKHWTECQSDV
ncbi:uncharacterized protein LOC129216262 isoform X2 [Uloborus diversus]|uniref:uncharacterized protein LOC129216262 isoform X2 n=1 Tax=Uloborus diversus TaxID=327109 RepID=UPI00240A030B|nr:uncharacterized protein LOC129216262 isoform X2 [Uloborus diversus]